MRDLFSELIERRLWPIALLLVVALVAVPVVLAKRPAGDGAAGGPPPAAIAATGAGGHRAPEPVVSLDTGPAPQAPLLGRAKDPFRQQHLPARVSAVGSATAPTGGSAPAGPTGSGGGSSGGTGAGGQQSPPPKKKTYVYASIDVRFGHAGERLRRIEDVPRLAPLPSAAHPIVVFLGVRRDLATAVFLVSTDVHVQGSGRCVPSRKSCQAIELRAGDAVLLDVAAADGRVTQYELDLDRVTLHHTTSKVLAQQAYARVSRAGAGLLREEPANVSADAPAPPLHIPFRYVQRLGVLHIAPWAARRMRAHRAVRDLSAAADARGTPAP